MSVILSKENKPESRTPSTAYFETMMRMMEESKNVMHVEADLGMSILGAPLFQMKAAHPDQLLDCGIQEANAVGVAAGMSAVGKIPFVHSFAPFLSRRACDQIFLSCCYAGANVKLVGSDPGVMAAFNGGTHMPFEDVGILRSFPELTILEPTDAAMVDWALPAAAAHKGNVYIRFTRKNTCKIYEDGSDFEIGKANIVRDGDQITIIACGIMVAESLRAAELLAKQGVSARVVDMFTIKPLDEEMVIRCVTETGAIVTAENHNVVNGLGSAVADVLAHGRQNVPFEKIGVQDRFGQVGPVDFLMEEYGLTARDIAEKAKLAIVRK